MHTNEKPLQCDPFDWLKGYVFYQSMLSVLQIKPTYCLDGYFELSRPDKVRSHSSVFGLRCVVNILVAFCRSSLYFKFI